MGQVCCSPACAIAYARQQRGKAAEKAKVAAKRAARARATALRHKLETLPELTKKAQQAFNRFIRLRDAGKPCISCGRPHDGQANSFDAGHYRSVGAAPSLRFDERNVHGQCKHCNCHLSGNVVMYRQGLVGRIGLAAVEALECDHVVRRYSRDELRDLAALYRRKARELG